MVNLSKCIGILLFFIIGGCKDEYTICDVSLSVSEKNGFYHNAAGVDQIVYAPNFSLTELGSPTPIYSGVLNNSKFSIPLNPLKDSSKFQISINNMTTIDTITFIYNSHSVNISVDCGNIYVNNLTSVWTTKHKLDSVTVSNNVVNNLSGENVKIYF